VELWEPRNPGAETPTPRYYGGGGGGDIIIIIIIRQNPFLPQFGQGLYVYHIVHILSLSLSHTHIPTHTHKQ